MIFLNSYDGESVQFWNKIDLQHCQNYKLRPRYAQTATQRRNREILHWLGRDFNFELKSGCPGIIEPLLLKLNKRATHRELLHRWTHTNCSQVVATAHESWHIYTTVQKVWKRINQQAQSRNGFGAKHISKPRFYAPYLSNVR